MVRSVLAAVLWAGLILVGCSEESQADRAPATPSGAAVEVGEGRPYQLKDTAVWNVPDPTSGRAYQVFISLPASYRQNPERRYPVLYTLDADYAFPVIRSITRRVRQNGEALEDFILVGLSYAEGDTPTASRNRDYTPTTAGDPKDRGKGFVHGGAETYAQYLQSRAIPFVEEKFRTGDRRILMGHSYGALLGTHLLFTRPGLFSDYILGSPSLWYDGRRTLAEEARYAQSHQDLPANIFMYIGAYEARRPGDPRYAERTDMVADLRTFEQSLRSRNYPSLKLASAVVPEENHLTVFPSGLTRGLLAVLPARSAQGD